MAQAAEQQVLDIIQKHTQDPTVPVTRETRLEDTGIDSYGLIEIVFELEEELKIDIPYNANDGSFGDTKTIGDLLDTLQVLIQKA